MYIQKAERYTFAVYEHDGKVFIARNSFRVKGKELKAIQPKAQDLWDALALEKVVTARKNSPNTYRVAIAPSAIKSIDDLRKICGNEYGGTGADSAAKKIVIEESDKSHNFCAVLSWREFQPDPIDDDIPAIRSLSDLCDYFGAEIPAELNHRVYKGTNCGASISVYLADEEPLHNGSPRWADLNVDTPIKGFTIQTIVEGSDATVDSEFFHIPCTQKSVGDWIKYMEEKAERLWESANYQHIRFESEEMSGMAIQTWDLAPNNIKLEYDDDPDWEALGFSEAQLKEALVKAFDNSLKEMSVGSQHFDLEEYNAEYEALAY